MAVVSPSYAAILKTKMQHNDQYHRVKDILEVVASNGYGRVCLPKLSGDTIDKLLKDGFSAADVPGPVLTVGIVTGSHVSPPQWTCVSWN